MKLNVWSLIKEYQHNIYIMSNHVDVMWKIYQINIMSNYSLSRKIMIDVGDEF